MWGSSRNVPIARSLTHLHPFANQHFVGRELRIGRGDVHDFVEHFARSKLAAEELLVRRFVQVVDFGVGTSKEAVHEVAEERGLLRSEGEEEIDEHGCFIEYEQIEGYRLFHVRSLDLRAPSAEEQNQSQSQSQSQSERGASKRVLSGNMLVWVSLGGWVAKQLPRDANVTLKPRSASLAHLDCNLGVGFGGVPEGGSIDLPD